MSAQPDHPARDNNPSLSAGLHPGDLPALLTTGARLADVDLLGFDLRWTVDGDPCGGVWVPAARGLSVLYGSSGVGKSAVISAIESALRGEASPGLSTRVYLRLAVLQDERRQLREAARAKWHSDLEAWENTDWKDEDLQEVTHPRFGKLGIIQAPPMFSEATPSPQGWFLDHVISRVPTNCDYFQFERTNHPSFCSPSAWWTYHLPKFDLVVEEAESWADFQYPNWSEIVRVLLLGQAWLDCPALKEFERAGKSPDDAGHDLGLVNAAAAEIESGRLICLEPAGSAGKPSWKLRLAAKIDRDTAAGELYRRSALAIEDFDAGRLPADVMEHINFTSDCCGEPEVYRDQYIVADCVGSALFSSAREALATGDHDSERSPFAPVGSVWSSMFIDCLPIDTTVFSPARSSQGVIDRYLDHARTAVAGWSGTILVSAQQREQSVSVAVDAVDRLNEELDSWSDRLRVAGATVDGVRLAVGGSIDRVLFGGLLKLEARDRTSGRWLPVDTMSPSQRFWVGFVLDLLLRGDLSRTVCLVDDVPAGIDRRSIKSLLRFLDAKLPVIVVASHAPATLRSATGIVRQLRRSGNGRLTVHGVGPCRDPRELATTLGVAVTDALNLLAAVLVVDGPVERVLVDELVRRAGGGVNPQIVIASMDGRDQPPCLDPRFLIDTTDAEFVIVAGREHHTTLKSVLSAARELPQHSARQGLFDELLVATGSPGSGDGRVPASDLIRVACERGRLGNLTVVGLTVPDLIMLLPADAFGLEKDWECAYREWQLASDGDAPAGSFRDYLQTVESVKIDVETVREVVGAMDAVPAGLLELLAELEVAQLRNALAEW